MPPFEDMLRGFLDMVLKKGRDMYNDPNIPNAVKSAISTFAAYAHHHPYRAAYLAASLALAPFGGSVVTGLLQLVGFGPLGPIAGTWATSWQATYAGFVPAGGWFAYFTSLAMRAAAA